jgi:hypothetical protein
MRLRYQIVFFALCVVVTLGFATNATLAKDPTPSLEVPTPTLGPSLDISHVNPDYDPGVTPKLFNTRPQGAPPLGISFAGFDFDDNNLTVGTWYIPPDPNGASGPFHVVNVGNVMIQWFTKVGVQQNLQSLNTFFAPIGPPLGTNTFDPKVIYDQYSERFVVITLERTANASYILVAVSKTHDPNLGWWYLPINSTLNIGGVSSWADYPGLAVDDKAIYITNNMFSFAGSYTGARLWIIDKNPFYAGGVATWGLYDPYTAAGIGGFQTTTQPAHTYGPRPVNDGTYLCSYSGLTNGGAAAPEFVAVIGITDPLGLGGGPFFASQFVSCGDIEDVGGGFGWPALGDAPQLGTATRIEVNDRRALNAVWRNNQLYASTTITPNAGADINETTAHWWRLDTTAGLGALFTADQGNVGGSGLGAGTFTFFPSVTVDHCGNMAMGFAASNANMYCGAYYTGRLSGDPAGTTQPAGVLQAGVDWYVRTFNSGRNRWGDYSGISIDPADETTFWVFNEYAMLRGTPLGTPVEDGRWATYWGSFSMGCPPVAVAITAFEARAVAGGVELSGAFATDSEHFRVNVYRGSDEFDEPIRYKTIEMNGNSDFRFVDRLVEPGKTYRYHIGVVDVDGEFYSQSKDVAIPFAEAELLGNKPNPFNPTTAISFVLPTTKHVSLSIYDASGKLVRTLVEDTRGFGPHSVEWNGTDNLGNEVGSGIYFYRLVAGKFQQSRKMVLLK